MKNRKEEEVQTEQPELEQAAEEQEEIEEVSEPVVEEEAEPKKEKKGMPLFFKFLIFELLTIIIALGAHYCLLQFVAPMLEFEEIIEWAVATGAAFVLYLIVGYLFNHLIVYKGKGRVTFPKFLLSALLGWAICLALVHVGVYVLKIILPESPLHYSLTALSINHVLTHEGQFMPIGLGTLGCAILIAMLLSFLMRCVFVFKGKKAEKKVEEEPEEIVEEEEPKEEQLLTHASFRQIVQEELDKFFTSKKKFVRYSQAQSYIDEEIEEYEKKHGKKEEE